MKNENNRESKITDKCRTTIMYKKMQNKYKICERTAVGRCGEIIKVYKSI